MYPERKKVWTKSERKTKESLERQKENDKTKNFNQKSTMAG